jgi:predicted O-methyltransferase YrrM
MAGVKQSVSFDVQQDAVRMLEAAAQKYGLSDKSKALRVLLDYAASNEDQWDVIFGEVHCMRCGGRPGWTG